MGLISAGATIFDNGVLNHGKMTFIKKLTASSSANLTFVDGASSVVLDGTFKEYMFTFKNIHPASNNVSFQVNFRDGSTAYDAPKIATFFDAFHQENGSDSGLRYDAGGNTFDAPGTGVQVLNYNMGAENDGNLGGYLKLVNPASATFQKMYSSSINYQYLNTYSIKTHADGYCNTAAAIDGVQFTFSSGAIAAGDICLYGISG